METIKFYVPSKEGRYQIDPVKRQAALDKVVTSFSNWFGGATESEARGAWLSNDGSIVREDVTIVTAFAEDPDYAQVSVLASEIKAELKQESIAMELGKFTLI